jgi:hypothetical protein
MNARCATCQHADVLAMLIHILDDKTDNCEMPSDWADFSAMHFERDNLISRWQERTGQSWPDRNP